MPAIEGVYTVMVTPFKRNGDVDYEGLKKNVEWQISRGIHGLLPLGSTGEFAGMEDDEKKQVAELVVQTANGRVPVAVGTTAETTEKTIALTRHAKEIGAVGVMILPPYYCKPSQEEMYTHFARIADAVDIPVIIYNNPWSSGVDMQAETVARLAEYSPNLRYVKECTADIKRLRDIRVLCGDKVTLFCGWEDLAYESFVMGARGWVSVIANIAPGMAMELYDLVAQKRDLDRGWELYRVMLPMLKQLEYSGKLHQTLKYSMDRMGLCGGITRSPKLPLTEADMTKIDGMLASMGLV
ncbi:MAG: 4-hydroxy-tetrahydrodipicolinate synthase [Firmicutes bacterium]|jgi:4-hydroxy-tetrahydrodipicolinate synthase|nr:4-hydroxy-tetrahydrodipicolinate synthase [Bacillota bacterium]